MPTSADGRCVCLASRKTRRARAAWFPLSPVARAAAWGGGARWLGELLKPLAGKAAGELRAGPDVVAAAAGQDRGMTLPTTLTMAPVAAVVASFLMVLVGVAEKRLRWRAAQCRVCQRPHDACTCRWL